MLLCYVEVVELVVYSVLGYGYVLGEVETNVMFLELLEVLERSMIGRNVIAVDFGLLQSELKSTAFVSRTDCLLVLEVKVHFRPIPSPA